MSYEHVQILSAIRRFLPECSVRSIQDRGIWIRHNFRVELDDGRVAWLKIDANPEMGEAGEKEAHICELLRSNGLPAPRVLAFDNSRGVLSDPFIIVEHAGGRSLESWLLELSESEAVPLYQELGAFFRRLHSIQNDRSGWIYGSGRVLDRHPNDFMHQAVVVENGHRLVEGGMIDETLYRRMVALSGGMLSELKMHTPSLVCSTLPWTVYLDRTENGWTVTKLTDLHDALYWDPADNMAGIRFPAFGRSNERLWETFINSYGGNRPDAKRMKYYYLLTCIDGILGSYMEPHNGRNEDWKRVALQDMENLVSELESLAG